MNASMNASMIGPMIVLFTDFGIGSAYMGQMRAVLHQGAPGSPVIDLFADAPTFDPRAAAYLLAAHAPEFPPGTVFVCVVDPGVGGDRPAMVLRAGGHVFVGPGNGLFEIIARRADSFEAQAITWRPDRLSPSFHGRDLFAPVAAALARGGDAAMTATTAIADNAWRQPDWPDDLAQVIYLDHFGNAITGLRAEKLSANQQIQVNGDSLSRARTFSEVPMHQAFWYENANGLVEIAVNQGNAARDLGLSLGHSVRLI
jgi:hypothetical protein